MKHGKVQRSVWSVLLALATPVALFGGCPVIEFANKNACQIFNYATLFFLEGAENYADCDANTAADEDAH